MSANRPLVSVFIDGLRADWVQHMPFVRSMGETSTLRTEFGYSIACHASMYTGRSIAEHGHWFVWLRRPDESRFPDSLRRVPRLVDNIPSRVMARKLLVGRIAAEEVPRGYFGVPRIISTPMRQWPGLWVSEDRFWDEPDYAPVPTIFDHLRAGQVTHRLIGLHPGGRHLEAVETPLAQGGAEPAWYYLFIGEVDHAAHVTAGEGAHFREVLARADRAIAARCADVLNQHGDFDFVLFSDHGHLKVESYLDFYSSVDRRHWGQIPHIVDTNFARFWTSSESEREQLEAELTRALPQGRVLTRDEQEFWECWFPDQRYGDVIFYLDAPFAFARTAWGFSRSQRSIHGYIPDVPEMSATLVTNLSGHSPQRLRDVHALHMDRLGLC